MTAVPSCFPLSHNLGSAQPLPDLSNETLPLEQYQRPSFWNNYFPDFEFLRIIADTDSSVIWLGHRRGQPQKIALKLNQLFEGESSEHVHQYQQKTFVNSHQLPEMAKIQQIVTGKEFQLMVMDYYPWNLEDILKQFTTNTNRRYTQLHIDFVVYAFRSILKALQQLHQLAYVHRDLKPDNFLVDQHFNIVISDFGLITKQDQLDSSLSGTLNYMPPERLSKKRFECPIKPSVDYWALGIILYELFTGETPFNGDSEEEVLEQIYEGTIRNKQIPKSAMELISSILHWVPEKRATLETMQAHPFLGREVSGECVRAVVGGF